MATFNDDEATSVLRERFAPKIQDVVFKSNPLFASLYAGREFFDGGRTLTQPIMYEDDVDGEGGEFDVSDESFDTTTAEAFNATSFRWRAYQYPIKIHEIELAEFGSSDARAINLLGSRSQRAGKALSSRLGKHLFKAIGTGPKQILSINDAFGRTNTYGGVDRSVTANSFWLCGQVDMDSTSSDVATALTLRGVHDAIEEGTDGQERPKFGVCDVPTYNTLWGLAQANQRYRDTGQTAYLGFPAISVDGVPIIKNKLADNDGLDTNSATRRKVRLFNTEYWKFVTHQDYDFYVRPFRLAGNDGVVWIARVFWFGNVYTVNPRYSSELVNILSS
jgi:hypothetical protein